MPDDARRPDDLPSLGHSVRHFTVLDAVILAAAAVGIFGYRLNNAIMTERGYCQDQMAMVGGWQMRGRPQTFHPAVARARHRHEPASPSRRF
jgi:hypothetical protein